MKWLNSIRNNVTKNIIVMTMCFVLLFSGTVGGNVAYATEDTETPATETPATTETVVDDENAILGRNSDVGIEVTKSITGKAGSNVKISFKLKSSDAATIKLKNVYPVIDDSFLFETSGDAYKIVSAGSDTAKQKTLSASFKMKARTDIEAGYQGVRFIAEYEKIAEDGTSKDYYVIKTINIYFKEDATEADADSDEDEDSGKDYDDEEEEEEAVAPKLLITGYKTEPEKIMAGETFKLTVHIQNTSKTTPVCNAKFLIGNEAGSFLPTSGSSAVFIESIPAGQTGDLVIEMKAGADLAQKNYILVIKGDFDDGKGNNFTSSDNLTVPVYQEVKLGITEVTMSPEILGIGMEGSMMFTINNKSNVGIYNVNVSVKDDAVSAEESYVGNIAGSSSAYANLYLTGVQDNSDKGTITVVITYEDSEGNVGTIEESVACLVGEGGDLGLDGEMEGMGLEWEDGDDEDYEDDDDYESGISIWVYVIIGIVVVGLIVGFIVFLVLRKKKRMAQLLEEDGEDDLDDENF